MYAVDHQPMETAHEPLNGETVQDRGLFDAAKQYVPTAEQLHQLRQELEGPKPLRVITGLSGLALAGGAALGLLKFFAMLSHPGRLLLQAYEVYAPP